jgi:hypothetical protein
MYFNQNVTTQNNIHGYNDIMIIDNEHNDNQVCYKTRNFQLEVTSSNSSRMMIHAKRVVVSQHHLVVELNYPHHYKQQ